MLQIYGVFPKLPCILQIIFLYPSKFRDFFLYLQQFIRCKTMYACRYPLYLEHDDLRTGCEDDLSTGRMVKGGSPFLKLRSPYFAKRTP